MDALQLKKYTLQEYLDLEKETNTKYEYHDGEVFAMAGGTINYSIISTNVLAQINTKLGRKNCITLNGDAKLHIEKLNKYFYPDAMIVCGDLERSSKYTEAVTNPVVIVEVLSDSTSDFDRGAKFHAYKKIKSLHEYILIEQNEAIVDTYRKRGDFWIIDQHVVGIEEQLHIYSLELELQLSDLYRNVVFVE